MQFAIDGVIIGEELGWSLALADLFRTKLFDFPYIYSEYQTSQTLLVKGPKPVFHNKLCACISCYWPQAMMWTGSFGLPCPELVDLKANFTKVSPTPPSRGSTTTALSDGFSGERMAQPVITCSKRSFGSICTSVVSSPQDDLCIDIQQCIRTSLEVL